MTMAITSAGVKISGELSQDTEGISTITDLWAITSNDPDDRIDDVTSASSPFPIPTYGEAHADFSAAGVRSRSVRRTGPLSFEAVINYSDEIGDRGETPNDPLSWPLKWQLAFDAREIAHETVPGSSPKEFVQNSAGDWFENQPTIPEHLALLSIEKNVTSLSLTTVRSTIGKTNSNLFLSQPVEQVLCRDIRASGPNYFGQTSYATVTYEFLMDRNAHVITLLAQGYNQLISSVKTPIKDEDGRPIRQPANLDNLGIVTAGEPFEHTFKRFEATSFAVFGITLSNLTGLSG